jgi:hypothetical protein
LGHAEHAKSLLNWIAGKTILGIYAPNRSPKAQFPGTVGIRTTGARSGECLGFD